MLMAIRKREDAERYLNEWEENINMLIRGIHNLDKSIKDFPQTRDAFNAMRKAWLESFDDPASYEKMEKRDRAILALGERITAEIREHN